MRRRPLPVATSARPPEARSKPRPSSSASRVRPARPYTRPRRNKDGAAWTAALVSASRAIRSTAWLDWTGSSRSSPATETRTWIRPVRVAQPLSWRNASTSERSAMAPRGPARRRSSASPSSTASRARSSPWRTPACSDAGTCSQARSSSAARSSSRTVARPRVAASRSSAAVDRRASASASACRRALVMATAATWATVSSRSTSVVVNWRRRPAKTTSAPMMASRHQMGTATTPPSATGSPDGRCPPVTAAYRSSTTGRRSATTWPVTPSSSGNT